jgi:hypothetical protein
VPTPIAQRYYIVMTRCEGGEMLRTALRWVAPESRAKQIAELLNKRFADDAKHCVGILSYLHFQVEPGTRLGLDALLYDQTIGQICKIIERTTESKILAEDASPLMTCGPMPTADSLDFDPLDPCRYKCAIDELEAMMNELEQPDPAAANLQPQPGPAASQADDDLDIDWGDSAPAPAEPPIPPTAASGPPGGKATPTAIPPTGPKAGPKDDRKQPAPATPPASPEARALTTDHESILAVLGKTPTKCRTVIDVASAGDIHNRETVGRLLAELAAAGLVTRPYGKRKGYALTEAGRKRLPGATPT